MQGQLERRCTHRSPHLRSDEINIYVHNHIGIYPRHLSTIIKSLHDARADPILWSGQPHWDIIVMSYLTNGHSGKASEFLYMVSL